MVTHYSGVKSYFGSGPSIEWTNLIAWTRSSSKWREAHMMGTGLWAVMASALQTEIPALQYEAII